MLMHGLLLELLPLMVLVMFIVVPLLFFSSIHMFPAFIGSLKVTLITLFGATFTALLTGSILLTVGDVLSTVKLDVFSVIELPAKSVKLPYFRVRIHIPVVNGDRWFMVKTLPLMIVVIGNIVPVLFLSSISMLPALIGSLKVTLITLFDATFTAFFTGSTVVTVGVV